jgi:alpha-glucosidase
MEHMKKNVTPVWKVTSLGPSMACLRRETESMSLEVLAPDLFRFRVAPDGQKPAHDSFAVVGKPMESIAADFKVHRGDLEVRTSTATFRLSLRTGAWRLIDTFGLPVFESLPAVTGPTGSETTVELSLADGESIFGMGENTGSWNLRGCRREFWNTDVLGLAPAIYPGIPSLYVSIPFALSLRDGRAAGLFWDHPGRQLWDVGARRLDRWTMTASTGVTDLYLFAGPHVSGVVERFTEWTGRIPLPPRWGLGFHQCRYSYASRRELEQISRQFRRRNLPCDALYLDIHHMDGYRVFTFGHEFPKPREMIRRLGKQGFKVVTIVDPGVKEDPDFAVFQRGRARDAFVRGPVGKAPFAGEVWPGRSLFPDFLKADARAWWGEEQAALLRLGVAGIWNDMNEPANFARSDKTLDPACRHGGSTAPSVHGDVHNAYGSEMARASRDGILEHGDGQRPFVITRAGYAGVQRHALVWTGDNSSSWEHLRDVIPELLNLSLSGVSFCGADVGGFLDHCPPELFVRWFQLATFTPFFRNHSNLGTRAQEPWAFGTEIEGICRAYLHLRYQWLPHLYSLLAGAHETGAPLMRPLLWHYPNDPRSVACGSQFLVGRDLLVAPILEAGAAARSVYLPPEMWYDFWTGELIQGGEDILTEAPLDRLPLFVRAGALLALGRVGAWAGAEDRSVITLACWPGTDGELSWYEDDEATEAYQQGAFLKRTIRSARRRSRFQIHFSPVTGTFASRVLSWHLRVHGCGAGARVRCRGVEGTSAFDPDSSIFEIDILNSPGEMSVELTGI